MIGVTVVHGGPWDHTRVYAKAEGTHGGPPDSFRIGLALLEGPVSHMIKELGLGAR